MSLQSQLFRGDPKLEAAAVSDSAHIQAGACGEHVGKIQQALQKLDAAAIDSVELHGVRYGPSTANAVHAYKQKRNIINHGYQSNADAIVGKMTIVSLDQELMKQPALQKPTPHAPIALPVPKEWFVTALNLSSFSAVVALGFTAVTGTIKFERPNGDAIVLPIGMLGPSVGLSLAPDFGKLLLKVPGMGSVLSRFPVIKFLITPNPFGELPLDIMLKIANPSNPLARLFFNNPATRAAVQLVISGLSGGKENWLSAAIGMVFGRGGRDVQKADFSGPCICFSVGGAVGPGNFGFFVLFFGLDHGALGMAVHNPMVLLDLTQLEAHSKGVAIISAASVSAAVPGLGAGATIFFGEIT
ncbi:MAG: hypothetical protein ABI389_00005 [Rhodanobacter sp.]